jgi:chemotaxis protein MotB
VAELEFQADCPEESGGPPVEEGAPSWTVTFGDMMSLLLTFFILLFSMSELKMEKFLLASQSMREAMGGTAVEDPPDPMGLMPDDVDPELNMQNPGQTEGAQTDSTSTIASSEGAPWIEVFTDAYLERIRERLQAFVDENDLEGTVRVVMESDGVYLRIETVVLFGSGEAAIRSQGQQVINALSRVTRELKVPVVVSGHADNRPINTSYFASNWELSAARAAGVARALVEDGHPPTLVKVESYGEFKPVADNDTPEGRAQNRRVELFYAREEVRIAAMGWAEDTYTVLEDPLAVQPDSVVAELLPQDTLR